MNCQSYFESQRVSYVEITENSFGAEGSDVSVTWEVTMYGYTV